jgi:hypothetical protein
MLRRRLFGWYVRFTLCLLGHAASSRHERGQRRESEKKSCDQLDARRRSTGAGARTTLEARVAVTPTRHGTAGAAQRAGIATARATSSPPNAARQRVALRGADSSTLGSSEASPPCGRPWSGRARRCYVASAPSAGTRLPGPGDHTRPAVDGSPTPAGYLASRACAVVHKCGWHCGRHARPGRTV